MSRALKTITQRAARPLTSRASPRLSLDTVLNYRVSAYAQADSQPIAQLVRVVERRGASAILKPFDPSASEAIASSLRAVRARAVSVVNGDAELLVRCRPLSWKARAPPASLEAAPRAPPATKKTHTLARVLVDAAPSVQSERLAARLLHRPGPKASKRSRGRVKRLLLREHEDAEW